MKRFLLPLGLALAATPALGDERRVSVTDFDRVQVDGPYDVTLSAGLPSSATISGSREAVESVAIDVQGRTLRIRPNRTAPPAGRRMAGPATISLGTRDVRAAMVIGSGSLSVDKARGTRIDATVSGSGGIILSDVRADNLVVGLVGSGRIKASGKAKTLRLFVQGSGDFDGRALTTDDADVRSDSAGPVAVGASRSAKVVASGSGDVEIVGKPACTVTARGSGQIICGE